MDINNLCPHCMQEINERKGEACQNCGKPLDMVSEVTHQLKPFTILAGKYIVGDVLGEGGFGITYIGFDLNLEIRVAIKEFYPNGYVTREANVSSELMAYAGQSMETVYKWRNKFIQEARSLAKCAHLSGVVRVKDFFEENNTAYIVQEYLEGTNIKEYMKSQGGNLSADWVLTSIEPVLCALGEVHKQGLIHRDISPDNIMLLKNGQMRLLDFGAARDYTESGEKSLSVLLKPGYAPEEQYRTKGNQGPWSDVYALVGTIYKCITGVTPPEAMERMRQDELRRPSELGVVIYVEAEQALMKAMAVYAEQRYQSMEDFHRDLYRKGGEGKVAATVNQTAESIAESLVADTTFVQKYKVHIACVVGVITVAFFAFFLHEKGKEDNQAEVATVEQSVVLEEDAVTEPVQDVESQTAKQVQEATVAEILQGYLDNEIFSAYGGADLSAKTIVFYNDDEWQDTWTNTEGVANAKIYDIDKDGVEELLVIILEQQDINLSIYEVENDAVVKKDEVIEARSGDMFAYEEVLALINTDADNYLLFTQQNSGIISDGYYANMKLYQYDGSKIYMPMAILQTGVASSDFEFIAYQYNDSGEQISTEIIERQCDVEHDYNMAASMKNWFARYGIVINDNQDMLNYTFSQLLNPMMNYEVLMNLWMWGEHIQDGQRNGGIYHFNEEQYVEYILPNSARMYLTEMDLMGLTSEQLRIARNEIYARHGRIFKDEALANYFGAKSWYYPVVEEVSDTELNEYEIANRDLIVSVENARMGEVEDGQ